MLRIIRSDIRVLDKLLCYPSVWQFAFMYGECYLIFLLLHSFLSCHPVRGKLSSHDTPPQPSYEHEDYDTVPDDLLAPRLVTQVLLFPRHLPLPTTLCLLIYGVPCCVDTLRFCVGGGGWHTDTPIECFLARGASPGSAADLAPVFIVSIAIQ